jgi:enoyl-CoA hydratase/carnithine racemase
MHEPAVLLEIRDHICQLTFNRPENRNSIDDEIPAALGERLNELKDNKDVRCVILAGSGGCFCGGGDFRSELFKHLFDDRSLLPNEAVRQKIYGPVIGLLDVEVPIIAAMNGHAIGGGLGVALLCDLRVASRTAKYGTNFVRLGCTSGLAISYMLPRIVGLPTAMEMLLTGRLMTGDQIAATGLFNHVVDADQVVAKAWELAGEIAGAAPMAVRAMKKSIYRWIAAEPLAALDYEARNMASTLQTADFTEGTRALLERRQPAFTGT